jgi:benzoylformate decarboxylase
MGDWDEPLDGDWPGVPAPDRLLHEPIVDGNAVAQLAALLEDARSPTLVVGAGVDTPAGWQAMVRLAERLSCSVWQDTFSSRAGFPQDHPLFAGHLPWRRSELRSLFAEHDLVLAVGTPAFRLYLYDSGPLVGPETRVAVVSENHEEILRSRSDLALNASPAAVCAQLAELVAQRNGEVEPFERPPAPDPPAAGEPLRAAHLVQALAERLPADAILVEEAPSTRPEILARISVREPLGFVAVANGALGFGLAGAVGLRMALPQRPVVALLGDGSAMYSIQALWTAARYKVGALFVVVGNGGYAIMDELAEARGAPGPWPSFETISPAKIAEGLDCPSRRIESDDELTTALDEAIPTLHERTEPLLLDVRVA